MLRSLSGNIALLAGLGLCVGCNNMPIGNGQLMSRLTGRCGSCGSTCPTCDCPCASPCSGTCGYAEPMAPGVLTSNAGPALPLQTSPPVQFNPVPQMGPAVQVGPSLSGDIPNAVPPRLDPTPPPVQPAQPLPADPLSRPRTR